MIKDIELTRLVAEIMRGGAARLSLDGSDLLIRAVDHSSKLILSTVVYQGEQYIPIKVRQSVDKQTPFKISALRTFLSLDEANYKVLCHYLGGIEELSLEPFKGLLQEFVETAEMWRSHLDEQDRDDRIHVRKN